MRLDHISYACGADGLAATTARLGTALGARIQDGGAHPRFGTNNAILALADSNYLEIVGVLEHPAAEKATFGRAVKRRVAEGGGWLGWVVAVDDVEPIATRLGRPADQGFRHGRDGHELRWKQVGLNGFAADPEKPFFIQWLTAPDEHPSSGASGDVRLEKIEMAGDRDALIAWLDDPSVDPLDGIALEWVDGPPGIVAVHFATPNGSVRIT